METRQEENGRGEQTIEELKVEEAKIND